MDLRDQLLPTGVAAELRAALNPTAEGSQPSPEALVSTPRFRFVVRFYAKDGLGNQLWRAAAAAQVAREILHLFEHKVVALVVCVELQAVSTVPAATAFRNMSPHVGERRGPSYMTELWQAPLLDNVTGLWADAHAWGRQALAEPWAEKGPMMVVVPADHPLAKAEAHTVWTDVGHDRPLDAYGWRAPLISVHAHQSKQRGGPVVQVLEMMGCFQRVHLLPPLDLLRRRIALPPVKLDGYEPERTWYVHLRLGDYKKMLEDSEADAYEAMLAWVAAAIKNVAMDPLNRLGQGATGHARWEADNLSGVRVVVMVDPRHETEAVAWAKKHFGRSRHGRAVVISANTGSPKQELVDLAVLASAHQIVLSPSSFGWWAAALGRAHTIVLPHPWLPMFGDQASMLPPLGHRGWDRDAWRWRPIAHPFQLPRGVPTATASIRHVYLLKTYEPDADWAEMCLLAFAKNFRHCMGVDACLEVHAPRATVERLRAFIERICTEEHSISGVGKRLDFFRRAARPMVAYVQTDLDAAESYAGQQVYKLVAGASYAGACRGGAEEDFVTYLDSDVLAWGPFSLYTFVARRPALTIAALETAGDARATIDRMELEEAAWRTAEQDGVVPDAGLVPVLLCGEFTTETDNWRRGVEYWLGAPAVRETMRRLPLTYRPASVQQVWGRLTELHGAGSESRACQKMLTFTPPFSEFNLLGSHILQHNAHEYLLREHWPEVDGAYPFEQHWTHGWRRDGPNALVEGEYRYKEREMLAKSLTSGGWLHVDDLGTARSDPPLPLVQTPGGWVCASTDSHFFPWIARHGLFHQAGLIELMDRAIAWHVRVYGTLVSGPTDPGLCVAIDLGAHVGSLSVALARALEARMPKDCLGVVAAVEPFGLSYQAMQLNINMAARAFPRVCFTTLCKAAVSPERHKLDRDVQLAVDGANHGATHVLLSESEGPDSVFVPTTTVDAVVRDICINPQLVGYGKKGLELALIKMDIEGSEVAALEGAVMACRSHSPMLVLEVSPSHLARAGTSARDLFILLDRLGYLVVGSCAHPSLPSPTFLPLKYYDTHYNMQRGAPAQCDLLCVPIKMVNAAHKYNIAPLSV